LAAFGSTAKSGCAVKDEERSRSMLDAHYEKRRPRSTELPSGCAIISDSPDRHAKYIFVFREARRNTPMMAANRLSLSSRAILFLLVLIGIPSAARSSILEDSAKELARKIAAALPAQENVSCEIRNISSLQPDEIAEIEKAFKAELQDRGVRLSSSSGGAIRVAITLSENFRDFVWTGEIHKADTSQVVLIAAERPAENRALTSTMPVTIHSEKFWEGPERILDAGEISDGAGKSWLILLLPEGLRIQDKQTGSIGTMEITSGQIAVRHPMGKIDFGRIGNTVGFYLPPRVCTVNLETRSLAMCLPTDGPADGPPTSWYPLMIDGAPAGPAPPGKGIELMITSVCGALSQFLATGAGDYTQTDTVQAFQTGAGGPVPISTELDFPGPIMDLHSALETPRAVVRNLTTGNYEVYRLSFSCGQ
jgi:hypothetical protein